MNPPPSQHAIEAARVINDMAFAGDDSDANIAAVVQRAIDAAMAGMVPIEDVKPLLAAFAWFWDCEQDATLDMKAKEAFDAFQRKHADKLTP